MKLMYSITVGPRDTTVTYTTFNLCKVSISGGPGLANCNHKGTLGRSMVAPKLQDPKQDQDTSVTFNDNLEVNLLVFECLAYIFLCGG